MFSTHSFWHPLAYPLRVQFSFVLALTEICNSFPPQLAPDDVRDTDMHVGYELAFKWNEKIISIFDEKINEFSLFVELLQNFSIFILDVIENSL